MIFLRIEGPDVTCQFATTQSLGVSIILFYNLDNHQLSLLLANDQRTAFCCASCILTAMTSVLEIDVGIMCACSLALPAFLDRHWPQHGSSSLLSKLGSYSTQSLRVLQASWPARETNLARKRRTILHYPKNGCGSTIHRSMVEKDSFPWDRSSLSRIPQYYTNQRWTDDARGGFTTLVSGWYLEESRDYSELPFGGCLAVLESARNVLAMPPVHGPQVTAAFSF